MRARLPLLTATALVLLTACPAKEQKSELAPIRPQGRQPAYVARQQAVDGAVPKGIDAYEAWDVTWQGMQPREVVLERFVRGDCFVRGRYELAARGKLSLAREEVRGEPGQGGAAGPDQVLLAAAVHTVAGPKVEGRYFERDPVGHLAWIYETKPAERGPPVEKVQQFVYVNEGCVLPALIDRGRLPARNRPATADAPTPAPAPTRAAAPDGE